MNKIVVLTGSFNPPTIAHLKLLQEGMKVIGADQGLFVPASDAYVSKKMMKTAFPDEIFFSNDRIHLLQTLGKDDEKISVDLSEINAEGKVSTYQTLNAIAEEYPDAEIYFLTGSDKLNIIPRWRSIKEFLNTYHFLVASRTNEDALQIINQHSFLRQYSHMFTVFETDGSMNMISSTKLRESLRTNDPNAKLFMTPETYGIAKDLWEKWKERIDTFREEYFFLSNFYPCSITYKGIMYQNAESAFQAQKCMNDEERKAFANLPADQAKRMGRTVKLREDWEEVKLKIMEEIVRAKFTQNEDLKEMLLSTNDRLLVEGNRWKDVYWGIDKRTWLGENYLGRILMQVRTEIKNCMKTS